MLISANQKYFLSQTHCCCFLIYSFRKHILSIYCVPSSIVATGIPVRTGNSLYSMRHACSLGEKGKIKKRHSVNVSKWVSGREAIEASAHFGLKCTWVQEDISDFHDKSLKSRIWSSTMLWGSNIVLKQQIVDRMCGNGWTWKCR